MIAVIADDFTGAAEIAGIGLRYGLETILAMSLEQLPSAPLLVISTDSRSLNAGEAKKVTAIATEKIRELKPRLLYKKIDSVFRGHVLDEIKVQLQLTGLKRALVIGANPSLGRTIAGGYYFINGKPINETGFAHDPEFAITDPSVLNMIKADSGEVKVLKHTHQLPAEGIVIGEATTANDIAAWADKIDDSWLLAGAGDFFMALLDKKYKVRPQVAAMIELPHLYISGTAFERSREFIKEVQNKNDCVAYLPATMAEGAYKNEAWQNRVHEIIQLKRKIIVAIDKDEKGFTVVSAQTLRTVMAKVTRELIESETIKEIFIEGGSTAGAVLAELGITKLLPVNEISRGVVRMKAKDLFITVKPGSYELPEQIGQLYSIK